MDNIHRATDHTGKGLIDGEESNRRRCEIVDGEPVQDIALKGFGSEVLA